MAILTIEEAAIALRYDDLEDMPPEVKGLLPAIDGFIEAATGKDWGADTVIDPGAKMAAKVLLVRWFEDPGMIGKTHDVGLLSLIGQLHAKALTKERGGSE